MPIFDVDLAMDGAVVFDRGLHLTNTPAFERAFFTYSESERHVIEDERRTPTLKLALALQIGFLRMTGRLLEALRMVPPALWRHLGAQFEIDAPDLASLRTMYRRRRTLFEQQDLACAVLGFHDVTEAQRRALVRAINAELSRTSYRHRLLQFARRWPLRVVSFGLCGPQVSSEPTHLYPPHDSEFTTSSVACPPCRPRNLPSATDPEADVRTT
jgi:hypothetical protein